MEGGVTACIVGLIVQTMCIINSWTDLVSFVTKEVDFIRIIKSQAVCFIPTLRENLFGGFKLKLVGISFDQ